MKNHIPPRWAVRLIHLFFKEQYQEQVEGDLYELFNREDSKSKARFQFIWNMIRFFRLRYLKGIDDFEQLTTLAMIKNYFKVAIRTLIKQRSFASINIAGLAIGLASCLMIMMYVLHERSYDNFYPEVEQVYRVANGSSGRYTPELLAETMMKDYPQVEHATKISGLYESLFETEERNFVQDGVAWADDQVFNVFSMEFIAGNPENALKEPNSAILTESLAKKFFPDKNPMDETIKVDGDIVKITGVVKDPPKNTHFPFKFIGSNPTDPKAAHNWTGNNYWTYTKIQKGVRPEEINEKMLELYANYVGPEILEHTDYEDFEDFVKDNPERIYGYTLHPVRTIHLENPHFSMGARGNKKNVFIFSITALFILLIACVNYINMSTARSTVRSKEVGIRKAMGSYRQNIVAQFLVESLLITFIAILLALLLSSLTLSFFNQLTGREFDLTDLFSLNTVLSVFALLIIVGLLAGVYPAYSISGFSPIQALRGQLMKVGKGGLRSGLVAFQFAISIFLIAVTFVIYRQVQFMQSQDLGVNVEQTLVIYNGRELGEKYDVFKRELLQLSDVETVAKASNVPFHGFGDWTYFLPDEEKRRTAPYNSFVEPGIENLLDLEIVSGRFFELNRVSDTAHVVINEALAKELGWKDPIGKRLSRGRGLDFKVIGVMKDFNFASLKREIGPMIFRYGNESSEVGMWHQSFVLAKVKTSDIVSTIEKIESTWDEFVPNYPFDAVFMSDSFQKHFESELKFGQVFTTFSGLAIFIAFLGLFALTTFVLQRRFKEIAVRKVLGATVNSLIRLVIKDFTKLVLIGGIIGIAGAYYYLIDWLEGYSYRIALGWYLLLIPVVLILFTTWIIVTLKSYKAAIANPSNALKEE